MEIRQRIPNGESQVNRAFTLIELLVVIAIIGILAALLFPVFAAAKQAAKTSTSISNIRQLGTATFLYAGDADEVLPMLTEGQLGAAQIGGYTFNLEFGNRGSGRFDPSRGSLFPYVKSTGIFLSSLDPTAVNSGQSFAMNGCLAEFPPIPGLMRTRPVTTVEKPAEQFLYGEESTGTEGTNDGFFHPLVDTFATWHGGKTALVFVDGHAKTTVTEGRYPEVVDASSTPCWPYEPLTGP